MTEKLFPDILTDVEGLEPCEQSQFMEGKIVEKDGPPFFSAEDRAGGVYSVPLFPFVDSLIGRQHVTQVEAPEGRLRSLTFESGRRLTPRCPCCGQIGHYETGFPVENLVGSHLHGLAYDEVNQALVLVLVAADGSQAELPIEIESIRSLRQKQR